MAGVIARVQVIHEVATGQDTGEWELSLQWCQYVYNNGESEHGYRFIWRRPNGTLQAARGQARIPSLGIAEYLIAKAREQGWGDLKAHDGEGWGDFKPVDRKKQLLDALNNSPNEPSLWNKVF